MVTDKMGIEWWLSAGLRDGVVENREQGTCGKASGAEATVVVSNARDCIVFFAVEAEGAEDPTVDLAAEESGWVR